jgi:hypothetical protein
MGLWVMAGSICQFYPGVQAMGKMFAIEEHPYSNARAKHSETSCSDGFGNINGV